MKKLTKRGGGGGGEGKNPQRPLGYVFWVVEGDRKDNLLQEKEGKDRRWKKFKIEILRLMSLNFLEWKDVSYA